MKKIIITTALLAFTFFYSQKNQNYLEINYGSVCCGPASDKPVMSFLKEFKNKSQIKSMEVLIQKGMEEKANLRYTLAQTSSQKIRKND